MAKKLTAAELHKNVPPGWYWFSMRENYFQKYWHQRRRQEIERFITPAETVLDLGCADGVFTKLVSSKTKARVVYGIDALRSSIDWAINHWRRSRNLKFMVGDVHQLRFDSGSFDAVFALEVLEHVDKPRLVLKEIKRVLKKGGYAILLVPTENLAFKIVWFLWGYSGRMVWKDTHIQSFANDKLLRICKSLGFKVEKEKKFLLNMLQIIRVKK